MSYVDTVYLPVALEPIDSPTNIGYLGTDNNVAQLRGYLNQFASLQNWPYYVTKYSAPNNEKPPKLSRPWILGAFKAFTDISPGLLSSTTAVDHCGGRSRLGAVRPRLHEDRPPLSRGRAL